MKYYISDTHFRHSNIIHICNRPYSTIEEMEQDIINKWNSKVKPEDEVYFLGDFAMKCSEQDAVGILKKLNGKKYFIKGNHDKSSFLIGIRTRGLVEWVRDYAEINDNGRMVVLFHYPIEDWNGQYHGSYHLFGHIHNTNHNYKVIDRRYNVGVDVNNFEPKTLDELIEKNIKENP